MVTDVVRLLAATVNRLRTPLLVVSLAPLAAGLLLVGFSTAGSGSDLPWALTIGVIGLLPAGWLALRRRELLAAVSNPESALADVRSLLTAGPVLAQLKENLIHVPAGVARRPGQLARRLWRGVRMGGALRSNLVANPRLAPFLPRRLRSTGLLVVACLAATVVLAGLAVLELLTAALPSW